MPRSRLRLTFILIAWAFLSFCLCSCATYLLYQSQIDSLVMDAKYTKAASVLDSPKKYGRNNELLYYLDKGYVLHLAGDYQGSISAFDKAKAKFDELYTKSVTGIASTWLINEWTAPYRGEDFERVMIDIFQALNYIMMGNLEDALVEARDVDSKLNVINSSYGPKQKNVYKEDGFARFLMGILYEANQKGEDLSNAFISYSKAQETYENDYAKNYGVGVPEILKENLLAIAKSIRPQEFENYRRSYSNALFFSRADKYKKAEVYLIQYNGYAPIKIDVGLPLLLPGGYIVEIAFPKYQDRFFLTKSAMLAASNARACYKAQTELVQDIGAIAKQNLANRKARVIAKAITSQALKYFLEKKQEETIRKRYGARTSEAFYILSNLFNVFSAQADLRSWQTLPEEIRVARLILDPGEYDFSVTYKGQKDRDLETVDLGKVILSVGQKRFFIVRSLR